MTAAFVLIDVTNGATTTSGEKMTPTLLAKGARAMTVFLNRDFGAYWGIPGGALVRAASGPSDIQPNEWPFILQAKLPEAPNAIAYHTVDGQGVPALYDAITLSDTLFGPDGWFTAATHELVETIVDPGINRMASDGRGKLFDMEVGDPVEAQSYPITLDAGTPDEFTAHATNFALPAYLCPNHAGPFDFMTQTGKPGAVAPPGPFQPADNQGANYQMWEPETPGQSQQINAAHAHPEHGRHVDGKLTHRATKKAHFSSRAYRRGLRLQVAS